MPNVLVPSLTTSALGAAALITGVYVIEAVFGWPGVSRLITNSMWYPDVAMASGFAVYSVLAVLAVMILLDIVQVLADPRLRKGGEYRESPGSLPPEWAGAGRCRDCRVFVAVAILAPQLAPPDDPDNPSTTRIVGKYYDYTPRAPSKEVLLGTAPGQFDIYYSLVWGTRSALALGLTVAVSTALPGILIGALSGYAGGMIHGLVMRVTDAFPAFPVIAGVWLLRQVVMPATPFGELNAIQQGFVDLGLDPVLLTLILFSWMPYARLTSANVVQLKQTEYVQAARSIGARKRRIIGRHLLPNALPPVIVLGARDVGAMVILATAFTFIGLGASTEWGATTGHKSRLYHWFRRESTDLLVGVRANDPGTDFFWRRLEPAGRWVEHSARPKGSALAGRPAKRTPACAKYYVSHSGISGRSLDLIGGLWYSNLASFIEMHSPTVQAAVLPQSGR